MAKTGTRRPDGAVDPVLEAGVFVGVRVEDLFDGVGAGDLLLVHELSTQASSTETTRPTWRILCS
jgi:hypothetical protein